MDFVQFLQASGLELPSPAYIVGALVFGVVGYLGWRHGRKAQRPSPKWLGLGLMLYPYAVAQTWLLYLVGAALSVWLYLAWD
jgi:hypothetical protein